MLHPPRSERPGAWNDQEMEESMKQRWKIVTRTHRNEKGGKLKLLTLGGTLEGGKGKQGIRIRSSIPGISSSASATDSQGTGRGKLVDGRG